MGSLALCTRMHRSFRRLHMNCGPAQGPVWQLQQQFLDVPGTGGCPDPGDRAHRGTDCTRTQFRLVQIRSRNRTSNKRLTSGQPVGWRTDAPGPRVLRYLFLYFSVLSPAIWRLHSTTNQAAATGLRKRPYYQTKPEGGYLR